MGLIKNIKDMIKAITEPDETDLDLGEKLTEDQLRAQALASSFMAKGSGAIFPLDNLTYKDEIAKKNKTAIKNTPKEQRPNKKQQVEREIGE